MIVKSQAVTGRMRGHGRAAVRAAVGLAASLALSALIIQVYCQPPVCPPAPVLVCPRGRLGLLGCGCLRVTQPRGGPAARRGAQTRPCARQWRGGHLTTSLLSSQVFQSSGSTTELLRGHAFERLDAAAPRSPVQYWGLGGVGRARKWAPAPYRSMVSFRPHKGGKAHHSKLIHLKHNAALEREAAVYCCT